MKIVSMFPVIPAKALHHMVFGAKAGIQVFFLRLLDSRLHGNDKIVLDVKSLCYAPCAGAYLLARASRIALRKARVFSVMMLNFFSFNAFLSTSSPPTPRAAAPALIKAPAF